MGYSSRAVVAPRVARQRRLSGLVCVQPEAGHHRRFGGQMHLVRSYTIQCHEFLAGTFNSLRDPSAVGHPPSRLADYSTPAFAKIPQWGWLATGNHHTSFVPDAGKQLEKNYLSLRRDMDAKVWKIHTHRPNLISAPSLSDVPTTPIYQMPW